MRITFHPAARRELWEAFDFYEDRVDGLGYDFLDRVEQALVLVRTYPEASPVVRPPARSCVLDRFPYSLIYRIRGERIRILAVAHQERRPLYWLGRMG